MSAPTPPTTSHQEKRTYLQPVMVKAYCSNGSCKEELETALPLREDSYILRCPKCSANYYAKLPYPFIEYKEVGEMQ